MDTNELLANTDPIVYDPDTGVPTDPKYQPLFDNLQGHIIKDNGRDCAVLFFLRFDTEGKDESERKEKIGNIKEKIAGLARQISSTTKQLQGAAKYQTWRNENTKESRYKEEELCVNFFLSANGYRALGFAENELPNDKSFRQGLGNMYFEATADHRIVLVVPELEDGNTTSSPSQSLLMAKLRLILLQLEQRGIKTEIVACPPRSCNPAISKKGIKPGGQNRKRVRAELVDSVDALLEKLMPNRSKGSPKTSTKAGMLDFEPDAWEDEYENRIDALIVLGVDNERLLDVADNQRWPALLNEELESLSNAAQIRQVFDTSIVKTEQGKTYYNRKENGKDDRRIPLEHFGFLDGVSNPLFLQKDIDDALKYEGIKTFDRYNPFVPLYTALVKDPLDSTYGYGSYLVFLKLEQNVEAFDISVKALKTTLQLPKEDLAGAFVVGRFKDGTPVLADSREGLGVRNNFSYHTSPWDNDDEGGKCPFHAHVRKVNHRSGDWSTRLVRRGITYGDRKEQIEDETGRLIFDPEDRPTQDVGLLFMSFQSDIARQFETIVRDYVMKDVPRPGTGFDCLLGRGGKKEGQLWPERWGVAPSKEHRFPKYDVPVVSMKGGEYFFAPSISFLREIDNVFANGKASLLSQAKTRPKTRRHKTKKIR